MVKKKNNKKIIFSDLHFGDFNAEKNCEKLFFIINECDSDNILVLAGDIWDWVKTQKVTTNFSKFIEKICKFKEIIWLKGNHDYDSNKIIPIIKKLFKKYKYQGKLSFHENYCFNDGGKKFIVLHGHQFDSLCKNEKSVWNQILIKSYYWFDKVFKCNIQDWIRKHWKWAQKRLEEIENDAKVELCAENIIDHEGFDTLIMGHTHHPSHAYCYGLDVNKNNCVEWNEKWAEYIKNEDKIEYCNCGDFVVNNTYITVENGIVELHRTLHK